MTGAFQRPPRLSLPVDSPAGKVAAALLRQPLEQVGLQDRRTVVSVERLGLGHRRAVGGYGIDAGRGLHRRHGSVRQRQQLLNEEARPHNSPLKYIAPLPGRGFQVGVTVKL